MQSIPKRYYVRVDCNA